MSNKNYGTFGKVGTLEVLGVLFIAAFIYRIQGVLALQIGVGLLSLKWVLKGLLNVLIWVLEGIYKR